MTTTEKSEALVLAACEMQHNLGKSLRGRSIWIDGIRRSEWKTDPDDHVREGRKITPDSARGLSSLDPSFSSVGDRAITPDPEARGFTVHEYLLMQKALDSQRLDLSGRYSAYESAEQLVIAQQNIRDSLAYTWRRRGELEYTRLSRKVVMTANDPYTSAEFPVTMPTRFLDRRALAILHEELKVRGATPHDIVDSEPRFLLVGGRDTATYEGFVTHAEALPRRWKIEDNRWVEVPPYLTEKLADGGSRSFINREYEEALVQDTAILLPDVMEIMVPRLYDWEGEFDPTDYVAAIKWINILNSDPESLWYNPNGDWGYFRSVIHCATKPLCPDLGVVIRHLR